MWRSIPGPWVLTDPKADVYPDVYPDICELKATGSTLPSPVECPKVSSSLRSITGPLLPCCVQGSLRGGLRGIS